MQTIGQIGGLAQQTALGASGLAQTPVSPTSWSWTDSAAQGGGFHGPSRAGPEEVLGQAHVCPEQQPGPAPGTALCVGRGRCLSLHLVCMPCRVAVQCGGYLFTGRLL